MNGSVKDVSYIENKKSVWKKKTIINIRSKVLLTPVEAFLEPSRTSMMEHFSENS